MAVRLCELEAGRSATFEAFESGTPSEIAGRLRSLGFVSGTRVTVERRLPMRGPILVRVGDGIFGVEASAAECILLKVPT